LLSYNPKSLISKNNNVMKLAVSHFCCAVTQLTIVTHLRLVFTGYQIGVGKTSFIFFFTLM